MNYYIIENGQQVGPLSLVQLKLRNITPDTPVWHEGMPQWGYVKDLPELKPITQRTTTPPFYNQPSFQGYGQNQYSPTPCPDNYLVLSIIATIMTVFCCFPFSIGIVALVFSLNVENKWKQGDYNTAIRYAKYAKNWAIISIISPFVSFLIIFAYCFMYSRLFETYF